MKEFMFNPPTQFDRNRMSPNEFNEKVNGGEKLVILDGYVLDIGKFMDDHPGGRFSMEHNIGRDISKFFHGGYSLEFTQKLKNHTHSSDARRLANKLIIARLENPSETKEMVAAGS